LGEELTIHRHRALAIDLVQAVFQIERLAGKVGEVNDNVHALRWTNAHALDLDRRRNQVAIRANQEEWIGRWRARTANVSGQEKLVEA
jgi:hypothetical protein